MKINKLGINNRLEKMDEAFVFLHEEEIEP